MRCDWIAKSNMYLHERWTKWAIMGLWMIGDGFSDSQQKDTSASRFTVKVKTFTFYIPQTPKLLPFSIFYLLYLLLFLLKLEWKWQRKKQKESTNPMLLFVAFLFILSPLTQKVRSLLSKLIQCISLQWIDENFEIAIETFCTV